jgi:predicted GTPase
MDTCTIITCLQKFRLIDTAGIRRRAVVSSSGSLTEALSVNRAFRAIRRSDVVALVIEAMACITEQVVHPSLFLGP